MRAYYELELTMEGTSEEIKNMLEVLGLYEGERSAYFTSVAVNSCEVDLMNLTQEIVSKILSINSQVKVSATGPFGSYCELNDVGIFREMAEVAPNALFVAEISGWGKYELQNLKCELKDRMLNIMTYFKAYDSIFIEYAAEFTAKIPYEKFMKLFKISGDGFDEKAYDSLVERFYDLFSDGFEVADYKEIISCIHEFGSETELDEDEFRNVAVNNFVAFGIIPSFDFEYYHECGTTNVYDYDPVTKTYVGKNKPINIYFEENVNELIAEGLRKLDLPSDDDAVANLSIEDAYDALEAAFHIDDDIE